MESQFYHFAFPEFLAAGGVLLILLGWWRWSGLFRRSRGNLQTVACLLLSSGELNPRIRTADKEHNLQTGGVIKISCDESSAHRNGVEVCSLIS